MRTFLENAPGGHNRGAWALMPSDSKAAGALAAGTPQLIVIPTGAQVALFSFGADVWVRFGTSGVVAAVPSAWAVAADTAAELNPALRRLPADVTHLSVVAEAACKGSVAFYSWGD